MKKITLVVAYLLLSISSPSAFPQSATLRGTITDAQSGKLLLGANIVLKSSKNRTQQESGFRRLKL